MALLAVVAASYILPVTAGTSAENDSVDCTYIPPSISAHEAWRRHSQIAERLSTGSMSVPSAGRGRLVQPEPVFDPRSHLIDTEVFGKMMMDGIRWTTRSSDEEFLRRISLDLTGQIPTADAAKAFLSDTSKDKRNRLIEALLNSEEFNERWTLWFGDLVGNVHETSSIRQSYVGRNAYYHWIREAFATATPYDQIVRESIAAVGGSFTTSPPANYWVRRIQTNGPIQDTYDNLAAATAEHFLGLPLNCLSCHDGRGHLESVNASLASRTRHHFWQTAAFFSQSGFTTIKAIAERNEAEYIVSDNTTGAYRLNTEFGNKTPRLPAVGQPLVVEPAFFLSGERPRPGESRRTAYARMVTSSPQFARASVNYVWKELFGIGIVEPVDSFDLLRQDVDALPPGATLQPSHPALLTKLAATFVNSGYDFRMLIRSIVQSNTYQLSTYYAPGNWNEAWTPYYARHYPHRLLAESVLDAVARATGVAPEFRVQGFATPFRRAVALPDTTEPMVPSADSRFMTSFGRGDRDATPRSTTTSVLQALSLLTDPAVRLRVDVKNAKTTVGRLLANTRDPATIVTELYLATLSRFPSANELHVAISHLRDGDISRRSEDLQLALIASPEFLFR